MWAQHGLAQSIPTGNIAIKGENLTKLKDLVTKAMGTGPSSLSFSPVIQIGRSRMK